MYCVVKSAHDEGSMNGATYLLEDAIDRGRSLAVAKRELDQPSAAVIELLSSQLVLRP